MKNKLFSRFLVGVAAVLLLHVGVIAMGWLNVPYRYSLISDGFLFMLFLGGVKGTLTLTEKKKLPFAQAFLVLTSVQMLSIMAVLVAFIFLKLPDARVLCIQLVSLFMILLALQSVLLIKWVNLSK